jgi:hypothetical protein
MVNKSGIPSTVPESRAQVAPANPAVVARMDATLRGEIDYPSVMVEYERQGHDCATRWTAAFPGGRGRGATLSF